MSVPPSSSVMFIFSGDLLALPVHHCCIWLADTFPQFSCPTENCRTLLLLVLEPSRFDILWLKSNLCSSVSCLWEIQALPPLAQRAVSAQRQSNGLSLSNCHFKIYYWFWGKTVLKMLFCLVTSSLSRLPVSMAVDTFALPALGLAALPAWWQSQGLFRRVTAIYLHLWNSQFEDLKLLCKQKCKIHQRSVALTLSWHWLI